MFKGNDFHGLSCLPLISEQFNPRNPRDRAPLIFMNRVNTNFMPKSVQEVLTFVLKLK